MGIEGFAAVLQEKLKEFDPDEAAARAEKAGKGNGSIQVANFDGSVSTFGKKVDECGEYIDNLLGTKKNASSKENMAKNRQNELILVFHMA